MPPIRRTTGGSSAQSRKLAGHRTRTGTGTDATETTTDAATDAATEAIPATRDDSAGGAAQGGDAEVGRSLGLSRRLRERGERSESGQEAQTTALDAVEPEEPRRANVPLRALAGLGIVAAIACGVVGGVLLADPVRPAVGEKIDNTAFVDTARTDEVKKAATEGVQRLVAIDHTALDHYHDTLGEFLTPELIAELDKNWPALRQTYEQTKLKVDAKVSDVGVSFLQGDRAEVLVVQDVSTSRDGQASGSTTGTYLVTLADVDGHWKLSKIPDLPS